MNKLSLKVQSNSQLSWFWSPESPHCIIYNFIFSPCQMIQAYAYEEEKRNEQYAYEEGKRNEQYEYDEVILNHNWSVMKLNHSF